MKHAIRPVGACLVAMLLFLMRIVVPSQPHPTGRRSAGTGQIRAAHFFGLSRYSWPLNYLSAFQLANVDRDLAQIAGDGFNAIVLLVPWERSSHHWALRPSTTRPRCRACSCWSHPPARTIYR